MPNTKQRGRPPGSSWRNREDYPTLERVADHIVAEPTLKPTTAMRRLGIDSPTDHKRLMSKWGPVADRYLREAQTRRYAAQAEAFKQVGRQLVDGLMNIAIHLNDAITEGVNRFNRWADENPEDAAKLKNAMIWASTVRFNPPAQRRLAPPNR